ncbi:hypothetical protein DPMN_062368 [Dreissena polymorpha]|uniref:Uncharacterized protein n=1 Tax=Dreissena polymorpha TaxID=45954 RepID=A0A9D4C8P5_DREPO|nr:hypothetical protein DPMN_062368 [Dreissena polymorpha]
MQWPTEIRTSLLGYTTANSNKNFTQLWYTTAHSFKTSLLGYTTANSVKNFTAGVHRSQQRLKLHCRGTPQPQR